MSPNPPHEAPAVSQVAAPFYLLTYDHAVGYPKIQDEAHKTMALLDQHPEWKTGGQIEGWTWDWLAKNDPGFVAEARGWVSTYAGRWEPAGGSYGQPYFTFISEESGVRQMLYGTRAIKEHLGWNNDIYIYSEHETMPQLPQILAGMGYRGAILRTHMQYGGDGPARDADWVLWMGLDGSTIPAIPAYSGLEQCWGNLWLMTGYGGWAKWETLEAYNTEMRYRGVRHPLISRCDDWGTRPNAALLRDVQAHPRNARWVTVTDYFDLVERSGIKPEVFQTGPNDFFPAQPWGYCGNRTWTGPRVAASQALTAEALAATAILNGFKWTPAHQARLDDAWKNLLIGEHHDSMIVAIYNEARDFTDPSQELSQGLAREAAAFVAARTQVKGDAVFVFNPTGHPRTEAVFLSVPGPVRVIAPDGSAVAAQAADSGACFVAQDVPALGYKVYRIEPGPAAAASTPAASVPAFETGRYEVAFGAEGGLVKLRDKLTGRSVMKEGATTGVLEGLIGSKMEASRGRVRLTCAGPAVWRAVETGRVGVVAYEMVYTFVADKERIDLDIRLDIPAGTRIGCPDPNDPHRPNRGGQGDHGVKLRYVFNADLEEMRDPTGSPPPRFSAPRGVRHQPLIIQAAAAGDETLDANLWASVETDKSGLAISNCGSMGYRAVGSSLEPILAYSGEYAWGGQKFLEGTYTYSYALIPYRGYSQDSYCLHRSYGGTAERGKAHRQAVERDRPLYALEFKGQGGKLPLEGAAVELPKVEDAVTVQALFPQDGHLFLRLCNMNEKPASVPLSRPVQAINLALTERSPAPAPLLLHPWRAQTYELIE
jgi:alpha-mannosidase